MTTFLIKITSTLHGDAGAYPIRNVQCGSIERVREIFKGLAEHEIPELYQRNDQLEKYIIQTEKEKSALAKAKGE